MITRRARRLLPETCAALALCAAAGGAFAGPPYFTDDPESTQQGHWETYGFASGAHVDGATSGEAGLDLNYGAGADLQLTAVLPASYLESGGLHVGSGPLEFAAKIRLRRGVEGSLAPELALFPRLLVPLAGSQPRHLGAVLPAWLGWSAGPWTLFGGGGLLLSPEGSGHAAPFAGLALTRRLSERLTLGVEAYHVAATDPGARAFAAAAAGLEFQLAGHWSLLASAGPGLEHAAEQGRQVFYVAIKGDL